MLVMTPLSRIRSIRFVASASEMPAAVASDATAGATASVIKLNSCQSIGSSAPTGEGYQTGVRGFRAIGRSHPEIDLSDGRVGLKRHRRVLLHDFPVLEDDAAVGEAEGQLGVLLDEQHAHALRP